MAKLMLEDFRPAHASWLRYFSAVIAYLLFAFARRRPWRESFCVPRAASDWGWLAALGLSPFCVSTLLTMTGLAGSRATDGALIIAMEPLVTLLVAWAVLSERPRGHHALSLAIALLGFCLLSGLSPARVMGGLDPHLAGNLLILIGLIGEGGYSVFSRKLLTRYDALPLFGSALVIGFLGLSAVTIPIEGLAPLSHLTWRSGLGSLYIGFLGTTATYLFWMIALTRASIASLVPSLFVQPVAGAIWGALFLDERLSALQFFGGALILLAISIPVIRERDQSA
jgi:drug/metabolite transporter (DMT)-like permease